MLFSSAYIELWMNLGSLESTQKARGALGCASSYSYAFFVLSKRTLSMNKFLNNDGFLNSFTFKISLVSFLTVCNTVLIFLSLENFVLDQLTIP